MYRGDIALGATIDLKFTTRSFTTGAPTTLAGSPVISAYVDNGTTEITAGITLSVDFDSRTGLNNVRVVASGGNGYAAATNVELVITTGTVGGVSVVGEVIGSFSINNRVSNVTQWNGTAVSTPATAGIPDVNVKNINNVATTSVTTVSANQGTTQPVNFSGTGATAYVKTDVTQWLTVAPLALSSQQVQAVVPNTQKVDVETIKTNPVVNAGTITFPTTATLASTTNITAGTITTVTNLTNAATAGDFTATMKTSIGTAVAASAVASVTGNVGGNVTGSVGSVVGDIGGLAAGAVTDVEDAVWDTVLASHLDAGSTGFALNAAGSAGDPWGTALPGAYGAGTAGFIVGTNLDALISSRMATYTQPTGFLTATFPSGTIANTTNITAGTLTTVTTATNVTTVNGLAANVITATSINADAITAAKIADNAIDTATFAAGCTVPRVTLVDTITTYTGNTVQTGDSFALIGATGSGLTSLAPAATALSTVQWTNTLATNIGTTNSTVATNLNATISSRMATYTQPTGFLAATFPSGTITNNTTTPTWYTGPMTPPTTAEIATAVWTDLLASSDFSTVASIGKLLKDDIDAAVSSRAPSSTALSTTQWTNTLATNLGTTNSTVATNLDATISSRQATFTTSTGIVFPSNFASLGISAGGKITGVILVDTLTTYTGNTVQTGDSFARIGATGSGLTSLASSASMTTVKAAVYDTATVSGTVITLSNGATQTVTAGGRVTA